MTLDAPKGRHILTQALIDSIRLEGQEPSPSTREAMTNYLEGSIHLEELLKAVRGQFLQESEPMSMDDLQG